MADPPATPPPNASQNNFVLKNMTDLSDDTILYDSTVDSPITFVQNVVSKTAMPNVFRTRKEFYGRFVSHLYSDNSAGKEGDSMFDPVLAAIKRSGDIGAADKMNIFVCVVHIEELQQYPMPEEEDWDSIRRIASNGGVFKSYAYEGEIPNYGDNVLVSFNDPNTRTEGIFINPLVGGASGAPGSGGGGAGGASGATKSCRQRNGTLSTNAPKTAGTGPSST